MKKSEHPRDRLGRPLPQAAADDPRVFPSVVEMTSISTPDALDAAREYLAEGLPFHAHEVLEMRWRCAPADERPLWKALAQWAAGLVHDARGNATGGQALRGRSLPVLQVWKAPVLARDGWALDLSALCAAPAVAALPLRPAEQLPSA